MLSYKYLPNIITCFRIMGTFGLLFLEPLSPIFYIVYTLAGASDILDGCIARMMKTTSELGAKLDSIADLMFYAVMLIKIFPIMWIRLSRTIWIVVGMILVLRAISCTVAAVRERRFASLHTYWNKLTGAAVFSIPYIIQQPIANPFCWGVCGIAGIATIRELMMHIRGKAYVEKCV